MKKNQLLQKKEPASRERERDAEREPERERRVPLQARSKERFERMLDAAAVEFAERGFDAATMEAIALRAGTSVGSIYQFFPNKLALFDALARRYRSKVRALFEVLMTPEALALPWQDLVSGAVDAFGALHESEPGFRAVWVTLKLTDELVTEGEALNREFAKRVEVVLAAQAPDLAPKDRALVAMIVVETVTAMFIVGARRPAITQRVHEETKKLLLRYLAPYATPAPKSTKKR